METNSRFNRVVTFAFAAVFAVVSARGAVKYAAPGGSGSGTGWNDPGDAAALIAAAEAGDEIRCRAGFYDLTAGGVSSAAAVTLSGGWAGDGDARGGETVFANAPGTGLSLTASSGTITLDSLTFSNCVTRGVSKSGAASIFVTNCAFRANGTENSRITGRGAHFAGGAGARLEVVDSRILDNRMPSGSDACGSVSNCGQGFYVASFASARFLDCTFARNGQQVTATSGNWRDGSAGAAIYVTGVPVYATNCTFRANRGIAHGGGDGGIVAFAGSVGGSVLDHCLFVGNSHAHMGSNLPGGTVQMAGSGTVTLNHCTIAYNATDGLGGGVCAKSGTLDIRNSIVACNTCVDYSTGGADFYVAGGTVNVRDSLVTGTALPYASVQSGSLNFDPSVKVGDPLFASSAADYAACLTPARGAYAPRLAIGFYFKTDSAYETLDVHLRSMAGRWTGTEWTKDAVQSPAIDLAAADAPYEKENAGGPKNGGRANAGYYGNTAEASLTSVTCPAFASASAEMSGDGTRVRYACALAALGEGDDPYSAELYLCYGLTKPDEAGLTGWDRVETVSPSATAGDRFAYTAPKHFAAGVTVYWQFFARTGGGLAVAADGSIAITGTPPANFGRGGGADVIHVWTGAQGTCGGTDWLDACTNLYDAAALVTETRTNVWIAGTVESGAQPTFKRAVTIRGGFTAVEDAPGERTAGVKSVVDCVRRFDECFVLSAESGCSAVECLVFTNAVRCGLKKTGAGSLSVSNCTFACNGSSTEAIQGRGAYLTGGTGARLDCVDVEVRENRTPSGSSSGSNMSNAGDGFYVASFAGVRLVNCAFVGNGQQPEVTSGNWRDCSPGAALYATGAPIAATNCTFLWNRGMAHNDGGDGGILRLDGGMGATVFDHCLLVGNSHTCYGNKMKSGTVFVNGTSGSATFNHCTIAYNVTSGKCGGIYAKAGTVNVRNSIVANNVCTDASGSAADFLVTGGAVDVRDSLVTSKDTQYAYRESGTLTFDPQTATTGDPLFATTRADFLALLTPATAAFAPQYGAERRFSGKCAPTLDLHLRSAEGRWANGEWVQDEEVSLAIDAAAADAPYDKEDNGGPKNGGRANAGYYGNTAEASLTAAADIKFEDVSVAMSGDGTRVRYAFSLGESAPYVATVYLCTGKTKPAEEGIAGWDEVSVLSTTAAPGDAFDFKAPRHHAPGSTLFWRLIVTTPSGNGTLTDGSIVITGTPPENFGCGGGADVIHVWAGAQGTCGGADWLDACTNLADAAALVTETRTNIWIAGTVCGHNGSANAPAVPLAVTIRGGFTGFENSPADRPDDGSRACVEDAQNFARPHFTASAGTIFVERTDFRGAAINGFHKSGGASLVMCDCAFDGNGLTQNGIVGRGLYATGGAGGTLSLSNCQFRGNLAPSSGVGGTATETGCGAYVSGFRLATLADCTFETNGTQRTDSTTDGTGRDQTLGFALQLASPAIVERCRFAGLTGTAHNPGGTDGALIYATQPCVFRNCSFTGSQLRPLGATGSPYGGVLAIILPSAASTALVDHCTFAYNTANGSPCAGVNVIVGSVRISNSIFAANVTKEGFARASDVWLSTANASATVAYSLFDALDSSHTGAVAGATLAWGEGNLADEARFATPREEFWGDLKRTAAVTNAVVPDAVIFKMSADPARYNVHLRGQGGYTDEKTGELVRWKKEPNSPGIDQGDPSAPYRREPKPNGRRANMGAYGNTPWATSARPRQGLVVIVQ